MPNPLLSIRNLSVKFPAGSIFRRRSFFAVYDICLDIEKKETFCLIGESGSGKSTLAWTILGLHRFHGGEIIFNGQSIKKSNDPTHQDLKSRAQIVFQDPDSSLSPFLTLEKSIEEPLVARGVDKNRRRAIVEELAMETGLSTAQLHSRPSKASGGQKQRACIARALSSRPDILFLDEPLTALDAVIQKQVAKLLCNMKNEYDLTYFLISHDLGLVKKIGTTVAVMYLGRIIERAPKDSFFSNPSHPYSRALLSSVLKPGIWQGKRIVLQGDIPAPHAPPKGCVFHPRCPNKILECSNVAPTIKNIGPGHTIYCHLY